MKIKNSFCLLLCIALLLSCTACRKSGALLSDDSTTSVVTEIHTETTIIDNTNGTSSSQPDIPPTSSNESTPDTPSDLPG